MPVILLVSGRNLSPGSFSFKGNVKPLMPTQRLRNLRRLSLKTKTMKNNLFTLLALLAFTFLSCADEPTNPTIEIDWNLDSGQICKSHTIKTGKDQSLNLSLQTNSLCQDSGVRVVLSADGIEYYNFVVENFPHDQILDLPNKTTISLSTCIERVNEAYICVWLGEVECLLAY